MCGLAGIFNLSGGPVDCKKVEQMRDTLYHRGPDGRGWFEDSSLLVGHTRLAIVDIEGGAQPLFNRDRSLILVANGEIYNHRSLRRSLQKKGHKLLTNSDCEVILHLYEEQGVSGIEELRGMFAFALWDKRKQELLLARDRLGEKPLYLYRTGNELVFASELKALIGSGLVALEPDPTGVDEFFRYGYPLEPGTVVRGVNKLPSGSFLNVSLHRGVEGPTRYWNLLSNPETQYTDPVDAIDACLHETVEQIVQADVPVGVALSGGMDSSLVAAYASRYARPLYAFSLGYLEDSRSDERGHARELADHLGIPIREVILSTPEVAKDFSEMVFSRDDPIADIAGAGYSAISRAAKEDGVPVLLQGQGGDELFWGYPWVWKAARASERKLKGRWWCYLRPQTRTTNGTNGLLWDLRTIFGLSENIGQYWRDRRSPRNRLAYHEFSPGYVGAPRLHNIYGAAIGSALDRETSDPLSVADIELGANTTIAEHVLKLICQTYLLENGLTQGDRLSMRNSVELRLPLVDYQLAELAVNLTHRYGLPAAPNKYWLRKVAARHLPDWVMQRPKRGFTPPVKEWEAAIFSSYGSDLRHGLLVNTGIVRSSAAASLLQTNTKNSISRKLAFRAVLLEQWWRQMSQPQNAFTDEKIRRC